MPYQALGPLESKKALEGPARILLEHLQFGVHLHLKIASSLGVKLSLFHVVMLVQEGLLIFSVGLLYLPYMICQIQSAAEYLFFFLMLVVYLLLDHSQYLAAWLQEQLL